MWKCCDLQKRFWPHLAKLGLGHTWSGQTLSRPIHNFFVVLDGTRWSCQGSISRKWGGVGFCFGHFKGCYCTAWPEEATSPRVNWSRNSRIFWAISSGRLWAASTFCDEDAGVARHRQRPCMAVARLSTFNRPSCGASPTFRRRSTWRPVEGRKAVFWV